MAYLKLQITLKRMIKAVLSYLFASYVYKYVVGVQYTI